MRFDKTSGLSNMNSMKNGFRFLPKQIQLADVIVVGAVQNLMKMEDSHEREIS